MVVGCSCVASACSGQARFCVAWAESGLAVVSQHKASLGHPHCWPAQKLNRLRASTRQPHKGSSQTSAARAIVCVPRDSSTPLQFSATVKKAHSKEADQPVIRMQIPQGQKAAPHSVCSIFSSQRSWRRCCLLSRSTHAASSAFYSFFVSRGRCLLQARAEELDFPDTHTCAPQWSCRLASLTCPSCSYVVSAFGQCSCVALGESRPSLARRAGLDVRFAGCRQNGMMVKLERLPWHS